MKVAVVLGNRMNDDKSISEIMKKRLDLAIKLNKDLAPDRFILSGGIANKKAGIAEAEQMYEYLSTHGIKAEKLIKEDQSLSTSQNAKYSVPIAQSLGADKLILCSTSEHINRWWLNPVKLFKKQLKNSTMELVVYSDGHI